MKITLPDGKSAWGEWLPKEEAVEILSYRIGTSRRFYNHGITTANHCFAITSGTKIEKLIQNRKTFKLGKEVSNTVLVICDKENLKPCYISLDYPNPTNFTTSGPNGIIKDRLLVDIKSGHRLAAPATTFDQFEEVDHTCYWADDKNNYQKIDFPRFNLTFRKHKLNLPAINTPAGIRTMSNLPPIFKPTTGFIRLSRKDEKSKKITSKVLVPLLDAKEIKKDRKGVTKRALQLSL